MRLVCNNCGNPLKLFVVKYEVTRLVSQSMAKIGDLEHPVMLSRPKCAICGAYVDEED